MSQSGVPDPDVVADLVKRTAALHDHLCPRQVLGVRMGMFTAELLGLALPQTDKRLFTFMETDGCGADGVMVATGCSVGHRTMRMIDFGKVAATFVDTATGRAFRVYPHPEARTTALRYATEGAERWDAQRAAYAIMPAHELLVAEPVRLTVSLERIISRPGMRALCERCGEEIMNEREVTADDRILCRACAGEAYYVPLHAG